MAGALIMAALPARADAAATLQRIADTLGLPVSAFDPPATVPMPATIERFDGPALWAALPAAVRAEVGALALELVCVWHLIDCEGTGPESALPPALARAAAAADRLINPAFEDLVHQVLPEGAFLAADGVTPKVPALLGGICRACGCTQQDGCAEGCGWAAEDLCTACVDGGATMSTETHRQHCDAAIAQSYERHAAEIEAGGPAGIGRRMQLDFSAALLRGLADLLDSAAIETEVWMQTGRALAGGLTGFLMTIHGGDAGRVAEQLPEALASIHELALARLADPTEWVDGDAARG